eukprot:657329-Prorocentrum_minimum.AAC.1
MAQLLLEVYRQISDPDAVYAVLRGAGTYTQLRRHEHENNWSRVVEGYDHLLTGTGTAGTGPGG